MIQWCKTLMRNLYGRVIVLVPSRRAALRHMMNIVAARPIGLSLETTSACNAKCVFCARRKIPQSGKTMSMELFESICAEYTELGGGFMGLSPLMADPLLDPDILKRISLVRNKYSKIRLHMFTNGIGFKTFSDDELNSMISVMDHIDISMGGMSSEDYKLMFGVDRYDDVLSSLKRIGAIRNKGNLHCRLRLHIRTHRSKKEIMNSADYKLLGEEGYECRDIANVFSNWGGLVSQEDVPEGAMVTEQKKAKCRSACLMPMIYLHVMPDGRVLACGCMDAEEEMVIGTIGSQSLRQLWTSEGMKELRSSFKEKRLHRLCRRCSYYTPHEWILSRPELKTFKANENIWAHIGY